MRWWTRPAVRCCDVSNIHLSGHNMGHDPYAAIDAFPAEAVVELHLGGFTPEDDDATPGGTVLIDTSFRGTVKRWLRCSSGA